MTNNSLPVACAGMAGAEGGMGGPAVGGDPTAAANRGSGPRIYVGGIPTAVSETMVRNHFTQWGQVRGSCHMCVPACICIVVLVYKAGSLLSKREHADE